MFSACLQSVGALYGLGCGPLAVLRAPLGAVLGGATGAAAGAAACAVNVALRGLRVTSTRDERLGFTLSVRVSMRSSGVPPKAGTNEKLFVYLAPAVSPAEWTDAGSDVLDGKLSLASRQLALQVVAEITPH